METEARSVKSGSDRAGAWAKRALAALPFMLAATPHAADLDHS
jgi:hypothetical protein